MKGIVLAGGTGSRLGPLTQAAHKHLLPVFDKPMIYYPVSVLIEAGISDLLLISSPEHLSDYRRLLKDGRHLGINIDYVSQERPRGIPEALTLGEQFIDGDPVCLMLGDNIFITPGLPGLIEEAMRSVQGAAVFTHKVPDASSFGVLSYHPDGRPRRIVEKPEFPESNVAVTGLYVYHPDAIDFVKAMATGNDDLHEMDISKLNQSFIKINRLRDIALPDDSFWRDAGTPSGLLEASRHIAEIQEKHGRRFACIEEAALTRGFISYSELQVLAEPQKNSEYGQYLLGLLQHEPEPEGSIVLRAAQEV